MYQEQVVTEIEKTKRALYGCLDRIRRAGKHRKLTAEFEERLEEYLEALRLDRVKFTEVRNGDLERRLASMIEERDQIQVRLHAIDYAYCEQSNRTEAMARTIENLQEANRIAGEELIRVQGIARQHLDDCRDAEKLSDDLSDKLRDAQAVIVWQEQLIVGQRHAIADMHAELTHSRVIRKAFQRAQGAFSALDAALHESAPYSAQKALGDDVVDAEWQP